MIRLLREVTMKMFVMSLVSLLAMSAFAYQVTGPIVEVTDTKIVVQKGNEKWELAKDAATKVTGDLKVGDKVTVEYKMSATDITAKNEKPKKK